jgi:hypothetical protein
MQCEMNFASFLNSMYATQEPHLVYDSFKVSLYFYALDGEQVFVHQSSEGVYALPVLEPHLLTVGEASIIPEESRTAELVTF